MNIRITRQLLFFFFLLPISLVAQSTLIAVLTDNATDELLIGGYIKCTHTTDSIVYYGTSDYDGKFIVEGIEDGEYLMEFTYIGYEKLRKDIVVNGDLNLGNVGLQFSSTSLSEIEVTAIKERVNIS